MTEQTTPYVVHVNGHADTGEPLDRLSPRDLNSIRSALHLYYGELMDHHGNLRELEHLAGLSRRLADVSRTWVAEEAAG